MVEGAVNGERYLEILRTHLEPFLRRCRDFPGEWRVMDDNAPCHRARVVKPFRDDMGVEFIEWPPYSPDLNPIENVWSWVKRQVNTTF